VTEPEASLPPENNSLPEQTTGGEPALFPSLPHTLALPPHVEAELLPADAPKTGKGHATLGNPNPDPVIVKKTTGRPPKITQEKQDGLCESLRKGHYIETACRLHGVEITTFYRWLDAAQNPLSPNINRYKAFRQAILKAIAEGEDKALQAIVSAEQFDPKAAMWRLERRFPRKWGRWDRVEEAATVAPDPKADGASAVASAPAVAESIARQIAALAPGEILTLAASLFKRPGPVIMEVEDVPREEPPTPEEEARTA